YTTVALRQAWAEMGVRIFEHFVKHDGVMRLSCFSDSERNGIEAGLAGLSAAAIEAGLSAYVVDGLTPARVKPVLDAAIARFRMMQRMRTELAETKRALEDRKVIDRAKGLLMRARCIPEDEAYALLRKTAMDQGRRVADVAEALVTAAGLLG
uniref:ANTAR domain-containing response regulator n=1 Tax=Palleronia sp. TaxID=1940284 RepID=UPI0035C86565